MEVFEFLNGNVHLHTFRSITNIELNFNTKQIFFYIFEIKFLVMKKYKVIKLFFKLSEKKNYNIGDTIDLPQEEAKLMDWHIVEIKETKTKKND